MSKVQIVILVVVLSFSGVFAGIVVVVQRFGAASVEIKQCEAFQGTPTSAQFRGCPKNVSYGIACAPFVHNVVCRCLTDGVEGRAFTAVDPPLADRESAERVWNAQCAP